MGHPPCEGSASGMWPGAGRASIGEQAADETSQVRLWVRLRVDAIERAGAFGLVKPADLVKHPRKAPRLLDRARQHQLVRVHPPQLDRHRHALVAAARVRGVEQPAAPRHEPDDAVAGEMSSTSAPVRWSRPMISPRM